MTGDPYTEPDAQPYSPERCRYYEGLFSPYIQGQLDADTRRALAEHLHECEGCAERFGLAWRAEATEKAGGELSPVGERLKTTVGPGRRRLLWILIAACGFGVVLLLGRGEGFGQSELPLPSPQRRVDEEIARTLALQNRLLEVLVEPLRGAELHVSHAARGEARDWFESFERAREKGVGDAARRLHSLVRTIDQSPGGGKRDREAILATWQRDGIPHLVLVEVRDATRQTLLCRATWGVRPVYLFLVREEQPGDGEGGEIFGPGWPPMRLALALFTEP